MNSSIPWREHRVTLVRSNRKTIALHVSQGVIEIRAPIQASQAFISQFLKEKEPWLEKTLQHQQVLEQDRIDYSRAAHIPFMGINVPLIRKTDTSNRWQLVKQGLQLTVRDHEDAEQILNTLESFYKAQAHYWLTRKTTETARQANLFKRLKDVRLRRTKTKWGHCTSEGRIQYNWQIMMAPEAVIDYLVAHEVSHLRHMNHTTDFWRQVESLHQSFKQDREWLHQNGHRLQLR
jgi:predicted metal-dependent hydrolase